MIRPRSHRGVVWAWVLATAATWNLRASDDAPWTVAAKDGETVVYERPRSGSALQEFKGVGPIEAEPLVVKRVLDDVTEYPRFMPYVVEARVLSRDANSRVTYQRLSPPLVGNRDYTIRVDYETRTTGGLLSFLNRWHVANELGPAEKRDVVRVKVTEGSWLLEPSGPGRTLATYRIFSDCGGSLPTGLANRASKSAIPRLFAAVRKQARLPKYFAQE